MLYKTWSTILMTKGQSSSSQRAMTMRTVLITATKAQFLSRHSTTAANALNFQTTAIALVSVHRAIQWVRRSWTGTPI